MRVTPNFINDKKGTKEREWVSFCRYLVGLTVGFWERREGIVNKWQLEWRTWPQKKKRTEHGCKKAVAAA